MPTSEPFHLANGRHAYVAECVATWLSWRLNENESTRAAGKYARTHGEDVWNVLVGAQTDPAPDSPAEAVLDTMPEEYRGLLLENEPAVAQAWRFMGSVYMGSGGSALRGRDIARDGWKQFAKLADSVATLAFGFGWDLSQAWQVFGDVNAAGDAEAVTRIAKLAGRFVVALKGACATRVAGAVGDLYSVEQGSDLSRLLPVERLALGQPETEPVFFSRLESRRLLQYSVRGRAPAARGPIVLAIDESGSMHGARNDWAKAATLAIAQVARAQKRSVAVVHYSTSTVEHELDPSSPADVLKTIRSFLGGGTKIGLALDRALTQVNMLTRKGDAGADVILVTDGIDGDAGAIDNAVTELGAVSARLWTVAIECQIPASNPLRARASAYAELGVPQLTDASSVVALAGAV